MRIKSHKNGEIRTRSFFAWLPVVNRNSNEIRWLERVTVVERYHEDFNDAGWDVVGFIDHTCSP